MWSWALWATIHLSLLIIFHSFIPSLSLRSHWHFTALYVCDKWSRERQGNPNEETIICIATWGVVFSCAHPPASSGQWQPCLCSSWAPCMWQACHSILGAESPPHFSLSLTLSQMCNPSLEIWHTSCGAHMEWMAAPTPPLEDSVFHQILGNQEVTVPHSKELKTVSHSAT